MIPQTAEQRNTPKTRAQYMVEAERSLANSRKIIMSFNREEDDPAYALTAMELCIRESESFIELATLAPAETHPAGYTELLSACQHIEMVLEQDDEPSRVTLNQFLYRVKSALRAATGG